jgi:hypothetical protein
MAPLALPSNFKWKLIFGSSTPLHVATSNQGSIVVEISKATPPPPPPYELDKLKKSFKIKEYEINKTFKDIWATKLPKAKFVVGSNGKISQVKCMCVAK